MGAGQGQVVKTEDYHRMSRGAGGAGVDAGGLAGSLSTVSSFEHLPVEPVHPKPPNPSPSSVMTSFSWYVRSALSVFFFFLVCVCLSQSHVDIFVVFFSSQIVINK